MIIIETVKHEGVNWYSVIDKDGNLTLSTRSHKEAIGAKKHLELLHKKDPNQKEFQEQLEGARRFHATITPNIKN